jgi:cystathionine beta-lyase/cystathionine gamma-synthase
MGGIMDPMSAFLALRGIQTLELRIQRQNESAMKIAACLDQQDKIKTVYYPGLASHPDHEIAVDFKAQHAAESRHLSLKSTAILTKPNFLWTG